MFSMDVKLKNKHTCKKRTRISNAITCGRYRFILSMFDGKKILQWIYIFLNVMYRSANVEVPSII